MRKYILFISILPIIVLSIAAVIQHTLTPKGYAAEQSLAIRVVGNHLLNTHGETMQLVGVNVSGGGDCIPIGKQPPGVLYPLTQTSARQTAAAIASWHVNVVRITMNEDCWLGINGVNPAYSGSYYQTVIVNFINLLHTYGIYAIVDLHINAPGTYVSSSQQVMADDEHAIIFWQSVATTFKNDPAVILEAYNEPHITTTNAQTINPWQCWRDGCTITTTDQNHNQTIPNAPSWQSAGMQQIITAIRATGATNPILVGGLNWSQDLSGFLSYLPKDPKHQLIAAYHNYMSNTSKNTLTYWNSVIAPLAQQLPVITSEMGEPDGGSNFNIQYMAWADTHDISYIPWAWGMSNSVGNLALLSNMDGAPTPYGQVFYNHFHILNPILPPTLQLTPTGEHNPTIFNFTLCPHGLGNCGDNENPYGGGNSNPLHTHRIITLTVYNMGNVQIAQQQGQVSYIAGTRNFEGSVSVPNLSSGEYAVTVKMDGFLRKQLPEIVSVVPGNQISFPEVSLVNGDINNDNQINILDYNLLISCYGSNFAESSCSAPTLPQSPGADIDDDGIVDGADYNLFLREMSVQKGQ